MRARRAENTARTHGCRGNARPPVSAGGSAPLATVVSLPTARAARPGAQRRGTPEPAVEVVVICWRSAGAVFVFVLVARAEVQDVLGGEVGTAGGVAQGLVVSAA